MQRPMARYHTKMGVGSPRLPRRVYKGYGIMSMREGLIGISVLCQIGGVGVGWNVFVVFIHFVSSSARAIGRHVAFSDRRRLRSLRTCACAASRVAVRRCVPPARDRVWAACMAERADACASVWARVRPCFPCDALHCSHRQCARPVQVYT